MRPCSASRAAWLSGLSNPRSEPQARSSGTRSRPASRRGSAASVRLFPGWRSSIAPRAWIGENGRPLLHPVHAANVPPLLARFTLRRFHERFSSQPRPSAPDAAEGVRSRVVSGTGRAGLCEVSRGLAGSTPTDTAIWQPVMASRQEVWNRRPGDCARHAYLSCPVPRPASDVRFPVIATGADVRTHVPSDVQSVGEVPCT